LWLIVSIWVCAARRPLSAIDRELMPMGISDGWCVRSLRRWG
jgi:hypothetical protein